MRKRTVKLGLNLLCCGLLLVIVAIFFHNQMANIFVMTSGSEFRLIMFGLFWGGVLGCVGTIITCFGMVQSPLANSRESQLKKVTYALVIMIILFVWLLTNLSKTTSPPRLKPGNTIII